MIPRSPADPGAETASEVSSEEAGAGPRSPPAGPTSPRGPRNTGPGLIEPHEQAMALPNHQTPRSAQLLARHLRRRGGLCGTSGGESIDPEPGNPNRRRPTTRRPSPTRRRRWPTSTRRATRCSTEAGRVRGADRRAARATRWSSTSGLRGAARAAPSSPSSSPSPRSAASKVAFLGVDSDDSDDAAETFLEELPLPYPSFSDPDQEIAELLDAREFPAATAFYDSDGELAYVHRGGYPAEADLAADIDRYAR